MSKGAGLVVQLGSCRNLHATLVTCIIWRGLEILQPATQVRGELVLICLEGDMEVDSTRRYTHMAGYQLTQFVSSTHAPFCSTVEPGSAEKSHRFLEKARFGSMEMREAAKVRVGHWAGSV